MSFNFPLILVIATALTGLVWLLDARLWAPQRERNGIEKVPLLVDYSRSFFPILLIVLVLRSFLVEPFRIPSGSMMPTLLTGDFILVNKYAYGIRLPAINTKILDIDDPQRGDVAVFRYPQNPSQDYIKRIVAVPGDRVFYRAKTLYINGKAMPQRANGRYFEFGAGRTENGVDRRSENLDGLEHEILVNQRVPDFPPDCLVLARGEITIPEGHYFVMGDNRDNSSDSRCWGLLEERHLAGKAFAIWMSFDSSRPDAIDWSRIGDVIR